jgi:hypothetical protein
MPAADATRYARPEAGSCCSGARSTTCGQLVVGLTYVRGANVAVQRRGRRCDTVGPVGALVERWPRPIHSSASPTRTGRTAVHDWRTRLLPATRPGRGVTCGLTRPCLWIGRAVAVACSSPPGSVAQSRCWARRSGYCWPSRARAPRCCRVYRPRLPAHMPGRRTIQPRRAPRQTAARRRLPPWASPQRGAQLVRPSAIRKLSAFACLSSHAAQAQRQLAVPHHRTLMVAIGAPAATWYPSPAGTCQVK